MCYCVLQPRILSYAGIGGQAARDGLHGFRRAAALLWHSDQGGRADQDGTAGDESEADEELADSAERSCAMLEDSLRQGPHPLS